MPSTAEVSALYVHPEKWQKRNWSAHCCPRRSIKFESCEFDQITLWVLEANQRARSFYESFGFIQDGAVKDDDHWESFTVREVRYRLNLRSELARRFRSTALGSQL